VIIPLSPASPNSSARRTLAAHSSHNLPRLAAWSYPQAYAEVARISNFVSFEPDMVSVQLDGTQLCLEPGQSVIAHGPDRDLTVAQVLPPANALP
jgi:hypothetical protein